MDLSLVYFPLQYIFKKKLKEEGENEEKMKIQGIFFSSVVFSGI